MASNGCGIRVINANQFVAEICQSCYRCDSKEYREYRSPDGTMWRLCKKCINHPKVRIHLKKFGVNLPRLQTKD